MQMLCSRSRKCLPLIYKCWKPFVWDSLGERCDKVRQLPRNSASTRLVLVCAERRAYALAGA